jgi:tetratricopeptide (TPR) repeat protein
VKEQGFFEEIFHAYLRIGDLCIALKKEWSEAMGYYMQAFEKLQRVEPLLRISEYYFNKRNWDLAYMFINLACSLEYPHHLILFVDKLSYTYKRWQLMSLICLNYNKLEQGKDACLRAIEANPDAVCDKMNLKLFEEKEKEKGINKMTKNEFIDKTIEELKKTNPKYSMKKLKSMANLKWKVLNK